VFSNQVFIVGFSYDKRNEKERQLTNFLVRKVKLVIYLSSQKRLENGGEVEPVIMFLKIAKVKITSVLSVLRKNEGSGHF
ncbi:hypothetical protein, partial [Paraclostridium dentum]|uniref:hypothetical protein n=1 Tax=Paraclostridium dentum TaxID=2662455 RepID=UPI003F327ED4